MKVRIAEVRRLARGLILMEGIKDELKKKFADKEEVIEKASRVVKPKFLRWAVDRIILDNEPAGEVYHLLKEFEKNQPRLPEKDIYRYARLGDLRDALEKIGTSKRQQREAMKGDSDALGVVDTNVGPVQILVPKSKDASCVYGAGTKWCISATQSKNYYTDYSAKNVIFYFLIAPECKNPAYTKVAIARYKDTGQEEIFDATDRPIRHGTLMSVYGPGVQQIISIVDNDFELRENTPEHTAITEKDPEKLIALAKAGHHDDILLRNPHFPHWQYPGLIDRIKTETDFVEVLEANENLEPNVQMIDKVFRRWGMGPALAKALEMSRVPPPKDVVEAILEELYNDEKDETHVKESLGMCPGLTEEQVEQLAESGDSTIIGYLGRNESVYERGLWKIVLKTGSVFAAREIIRKAVRWEEPEPFIAARGIAPSAAADALTDMLSRLTSAWGNDSVEDGTWKVVKPEFLTFFRRVGAKFTEAQIRDAYRGYPMAADAARKELIRQGLYTKEVKQ